MQANKIEPNGSAQDEKTRDINSLDGKSLDRNSTDGKIQKKEVIERENWGGKAEFVLSCLGYAVGLGNVWKFPYMVYSNGGGAFLLPYILMLLLVGLPCFFMEMIVGQYSGCGPMHLWAISPLFTGIGLGMVILTILTSISYNVIMGWAFYYMFASWQKVLPWYTCANTYNTDYCYTKREAMDNNCEKETSNSTTNSTTITKSWWFNRTCYNQSYCDGISGNIGNSVNGNSDRVDPCNFSQVLKVRKGATEEYFNLRVLNQSNSIDDTGELQWEMVLVLLLAWIVCYLCVIKGIKSAGKVVYFTAIFPYVILIVLLVRGAMLPGALDGVIFYINPQWDKIANAKVWVDSAGQVFFSLSVGMGGLMTFASYNKFNNNIYRDTLIVVLLDMITSIVAGFAIFCILGHLSYALGKPVGEVVTQGPGLAFIAYPEVVTYLQPPQLWATLFFLMLITLGIDTQMASIETVMTACVDFYPFLRRWKPIVAAIICFLLFLLGLPMCARSGIYWLEVMSTYSSGWSLVFIAAIEIMVFSWLYGARRLMRDVETMTGVKLFIHWWVIFTIVSPLILLGILLYSFIDYTPPRYNDGTDYPAWSQVLGMMMAVVSVFVVPIISVYIIWKSYSQEEYDGLKFHKRIWKLMHASKDWIPSIEKLTVQELEKQMPAQYVNDSFIEDNDQINNNNNYNNNKNNNNINDDDDFNVSSL